MKNVLKYLKNTVTSRFGRNKTKTTNEDKMQALPSTVSVNNPKQDSLEELCAKDPSSDTTQIQTQTDKDPNSEQQVGEPYRSCNPRALNTNKYIPKDPITRDFHLLQSNHEITQDIVVKEGGVLRIEEGSTFRFAENAGIYCDGGQVLIVGENGYETSFTALDKQKGWKGIIRTNSPDQYKKFNPIDLEPYTVILKNCLIEYGRGRNLKEETHLSDTDKIMSGTDGGGLNIINSNAILTNVRFENNNAEHGGAVNILNSNVKITNGKFLSNTSYLEGGAIHCSSTNLELNKLLIANCASRISGGAIEIFFSHCKAHNLTIKNNKARCGGGICKSLSELEIYQGVISNNHASENGGAMRIFESYGSSYIKNTTFENNTAPKGGAISNYRLTHIEFANCTFANNDAEQGNIIYALKGYKSSPGKMKLSYCKVRQTIDSPLESFTDNNRDIFIEPNRKSDDKVIITD